MEIYTYIFNVSSSITEACNTARDLCCARVVVSKTLLTFQLKEEYFMIFIIKVFNLSSFYLTVFKTLTRGALSLCLTGNLLKNNL